MKKPLIILTGPTSVGKTDTSIELAKRINGSVISADSMQVYRGLDIGTAKIKKEEMQGIPHYLIDVLDPTDEFNVVAFKEMAERAIEDIYAQGRIPIITGGTGFYIQAVLYDIDFTETCEDKNARENYYEYAAKYGNKALHDMLAEVDPKAAEEIHENNVKRVVRALEFYYETGTKISGHNEEQKAKTSPYDFLYFVLYDERARVYKRINERVDKMMEAGLEAEVRGLYDAGLREENISMKGIGYREFFPYFEGKEELKEVVENIKKDTRHFAKKQITWFKKERDVKWIDIAAYSRKPAKIAEYIAKIMKKKGMLEETEKKTTVEPVISPIISKSSTVDELKNVYASLGISEDVYMYSEKIWNSLKDRFDEIDRVAEANQLKVLGAMHKCQVTESCLYPTTGYGYNDKGRETLEKVYAEVFHTEDALVRPLIACGTHALSIALSGNLRPGDELLCPAGKPYDTLEEVIGIRESKGSLMEYGVSYRQVDLLPDGTFDYENIKAAINEKTKLAAIQRSKGYQTRPSFSVKQIGELIAFIKGINPNIICMVDNCYGEFVEINEPSDVGADMIVGSLIKNPGGGLAPIGGYIAGKKEYVENAAVRLTCPGLGKEVGATLGVNREFFQGFFLAPSVTAAALKGAIFAANIYENLGFDVIPNGKEDRHDIIQAVTFGKPEGVIAFCQGIQSASPIDAHVYCEPWDMPGYDSEVIMAAGTFVSGASIELSADGPIRPPYAVYFQGGVTKEHAKYGIINSLQKIVDAGLVDRAKLV